MQIHPFQRQHLPLAVLILLIAAFLRLDDLAWFGYEYDSADLVRPALDFVHGEGLPTKGVLTSRGVYNPPAMGYLMAIPSAFSDDPLFGVLFIRFLNLVGVALLYALAYRYLAPQVAFWAGLAYAVSPWAVMYSSILWNVTLHTPFLLAGFLLAAYGFWEGKKWAQALCIPVFMVVPQIHFSGFLLLPALGWIMLLGWRKLSFGAIFLGIGLFLLTLASFITGLSPQDRADYQAFLTGEDTESAPFSFTNRPFTRTLDLLTGRALENPLADSVDYEKLILAAAPRPDALWLLLGLPVFIGLVSIWWRSWRWGILLSLWTSSLIVGTLDANRVAAHYHYLILLVPSLMLWLGVGFAWLWEQLPLKTYSRAALAGVFSLILVSQVVWWNQAQAYVGEHFMPGHGTPYSYFQPLRAELARHEDVIILGAGSNSGSFVWQTLLIEVPCVREPLIPEGGLMIFPAHPFAVLYPSEGQANYVDPWTRAMYTSGAETVYPARQNETVNRIFAFPEPPAWNYATLLPVSTPSLNNGAQLTGYARESGLLFLEWRLTPQDRANYQYFVHFVDANGEKIGQRDSTFLAGAFWCAGDRVVTWIPAEIPQTTAILRVGMYEILPDGGLRTATTESGSQSVEVQLP